MELPWLHWIKHREYHPHNNNIRDKFFHSEKIEGYSLEKIRLACEYFGNPEKSFKSVHIAGTNGKWSTSKMIFQILKESGKRVWVYTSPHNIDIRERFEWANCLLKNSHKSNKQWDELISEEDFIIYAERIIAYGRWLSYFEKCVLLAFLYFRDIGCEYAVIEVGMGGRLDATNVITPILSIITSISYDHMEFLGDTLEEIATEKWEIIKPWIPVILSDKNKVLEEIAAERNSRVIFPTKRETHTNLLGNHQISNAQIAYEAGRFLGISDEIIQNALLHVNHHGRLEYIRENLLIDGAHNEDGMKKLREYLKWLKAKWEEIVFCVNIKRGKSAKLFIDIFPEVTTWNIVHSEGFMVSDSAMIASEVVSLGKTSKIVLPSDIFDFANRNPKKLFVVFGSLYMMKEFLK